MPTGPGSSVNGVWKFGEDDSNPLFSDLLNRLGDSIRPSDWIAPTLGNSWVNFGGGYRTARYRKTADVVDIEGVIKSGTGSTTIFTLAAGYRPAQLVLIPTVGNGTAGSLYIDPSGTVQLVGGSNVNLSLQCRFATS